MYCILIASIEYLGGGVHYSCGGAIKLSIMTR